MRLMCTKGFVTYIWLCIENDKKKTVTISFIICKISTLIIQLILTDLVYTVRVLTFRMGVDTIDTLAIKSKRTYSH